MLTRAKAPGTCGELVQGAIAGRDFLVNCPVNLFSHATVCASSTPGLQVSAPNHFRKIAEAIGLMSRRYGVDLQHEVRVESDIPRSKGMASSTADICAALAALCRSCSFTLSNEAFARLIASVEPSDCVHFPGIAHVNHLTGEHIESMPAPSDLRVLVVDCGGAVETLEFDRERARSVYRQNEATIARALALLKKGLREADARAIAQAATESARLSQQILFKPQFRDLLRTTREAHALGVNCAHSGTVLGVLYRGADDLKDDLVAVVERTFGNDVEIIGDFGIIGGGCSEL